METIFVILVVALAVLHLAWRSFRILRGSGKPGCASGCGGCSSATKPNVVTLELGRSATSGRSWIMDENGARRGRSDGAEIGDRGSGIEK